ncbi:MAG: hypothetical protein AAF721_31195 [Myxococcota bacterium]
MACLAPPAVEPDEDEDDDEDEDEDEVETGAVFASYPYEAGDAGYVRQAPLSEEFERFAAGRVSVEGGYAGSGVWRGGGELELRFWRFALATDLAVLTDPRARQASYVGSFAAPLSIVMQPRVQWGIGPGFTYVASARTSTPLGASGSTRVDVFPAKPFVLSGRLDVGRLRAEHLDLGSPRPYTFTARAQAGVLLRRWELYGGYAYKSIGTLAAYGPLAGVRAWF